MGVATPDPAEHCREATTAGGFRAAALTRCGRACRSPPCVVDDVAVDTPFLDVEAIRRSSLRPAGAWSSVDVVPSSASTNTELLERAQAAARDGAPLDAPLALAAEHQTAGIGRAGRRWETPPRAALTVSFLLRPDVPPEVLGWLPLVSGVALVRVLRAAGVPAALKLSLIHI